MSNKGKIWRLEELMDDSDDDDEEIYMADEPIRSGKKEKEELSSDEDYEEVNRLIQESFGFSQNLDDPFDDTVIMSMHSESEEKEDIYGKNEKEEEEEYSDVEWEEEMDLFPSSPKSVSNTSLSMYQPTQDFLNPALQYYGLTEISDTRSSKVFRKVLSDGTIVAVKIPNSIMREYDEEFKNDARKLNAFRHPCIIEAMFFEQNIGNEKVRFIVTPYQPLGNLETFSKRPMVETDIPQTLLGKRFIEEGHIYRRFGEKNAFTVFYQIISALKYLHSHGVYHNDIKMENILVHSIDDNGTMNILLTDFGKADEKGSTFDMTTVYPIKTIYLPRFLQHERNARPEIIPVPAHVLDVYGAVVIMYMLTTGDYPFEISQHPRETFDFKKYRSTIGLHFDRIFERIFTEDSDMDTIEITKTSAFKELQMKMNYLLLPTGQKHKMTGHDAYQWVVNEPEFVNGDTFPEIRRENLLSEYRNKDYIIAFYNGKVEKVGDSILLRIVDKDFHIGILYDFITGLRAFDPKFEIVMSEKDAVETVFRIVSGLSEFYKRHGKPHYNVDFAKIRFTAGYEIIFDDIVKQLEELYLVKEDYEFGKTKVADIFRIINPAKSKNELVKRYNMFIGFRAPHEHRRQMHRNQEYIGNDLDEDEMYFSDLWSCFTLLYVLVEGRMPFTSSIQLLGSGKWDSYHVDFEIGPPFFHNASKDVSNFLRQALWNRDIRSIEFVLARLHALIEKLKTQT